jgi:hypothetical protein
VALWRDPSRPGLVADARRMTITAPPHGSRCPSSTASAPPTDPPTFDSHRSLATRCDLDSRVRQLVPCAVQRQLWLLLFDADDVQLPVMVPLGDIPLRGGSADGEGLIEMLRSLAREFGAESFVFILERPGPPSPRYDDRLWLTMLLSIGPTETFRVRAAYLAHDDGIAGYDMADLPDLEREPTAAGGDAASRPLVKLHGCDRCAAAADVRPPQASGDESRCRHQAVSASSLEV